MRLARPGKSSASRRELLELVFDPEPDLDQSAALRDREPAPYMGHRHLRFALRRAAVHLELDLAAGQTLTPGSYERAREELLAEAGRRRCRDLLAELLPSGGQIERIAARADDGDADEEGEEERADDDDDDRRRASAGDCGVTGATSDEASEQSGRDHDDHRDGLWDQVLALAGLPRRSRAPAYSPLAQGAVQSCRRHGVFARHGGWRQLLQAGNKNP
jgi:hypothetical protein